MPTTSSSTSATQAPATSAASAGWARDFYDDFATLTTGWGKYGYGIQPIGHGAMGNYNINNVFVQDGELNMRVKYDNGVWSGAGVSGNRGFSAIRGKWEVRARFDRSKGIGYALLLYPSDGTWPPEIDIAEGRYNGPRMESTFHWGSDNQQIHKAQQVADMTQWHTYGVILTDTSITYTTDGVPWATVPSTNVPNKKMWIGFQTGAHSCPSNYECVTNNVPDADTPASAAIHIDWVAHYAQT